MQGSSYDSDLHGDYQRCPSMTVEDALPLDTIPPWLSSSPSSPYASHLDPQQPSLLTLAGLGHDQTKYGALINPSALRAGAEQELASGSSSFLPPSSPLSPSYTASLHMPEPHMPTNDAQPQPAQPQRQSARAVSKTPVSSPPATPQQPQHISSATSNAGVGLKYTSAAGGAEAQNDAGSGPTAAQKGNDNTNKIWNTSTTEERERIKDFYLGLGEQERRNLVKIEKDTVLRKMKEQQKHSCSCAVCGRKRNAIEEELEVLYDTYYEELEQYANYQQRYVSSGGSIPPPPGPGPFPGSVELDKDAAVVSPATLEPLSPSRKGPVQAPAGGRQNVAGKGRDGLFNIGSSLSVTGPSNILTVADDLLKNEGQKFLEMMKQLAERRRQREEDAKTGMEDESEEESEGGGSDTDGEDGDDSGSEEEDEKDEEDDEEEMTEEQKMEEGKRMFSIFAARMFEQRVLEAYREKVAQERRRQLRELEEAKAMRDQKYATEPAHDDHPPAPTSTSRQDDVFTREEVPIDLDLMDLDERHPSTARSPRRSDPNMKPPPRAGRDSHSSAEMFTNAHINELNGGTFNLNNVAHIYESDSPAAGTAPALQIAVLGLQAASFATHYSHCNYPLAPPPIMASPSTVYVALQFPSLYREMKIMITPLTLWLFVKMWIQRRAIEHH